MPQPEPVDTLLLASAAGRRLGVSAATVGLWARRGLIRHLTTSTGTRLYPASEVERLRVERDAAAIAQQYAGATR